MKKTVFATWVCVALASCVNDEILENKALLNENQEIYFEAPVMSAMTKGAIESRKYPTIIPFHVYGSLAPSDWTFMNEKISFQNGLWKPAEIHYWPHENDVSFVAYSPEIKVNDKMGNPAALPPTAIITGNNLIISDYSVEKNLLADGVSNIEADKQTDLLVSNVTTVLKDATKLAVPITFKHALSYIKFTASASGINESIKIKSIKIESIHNIGTLTVPLSDVQTISWEFLTPNDLIDLNKTFEGGFDILNLPPDQILAKWLIIPQDLANAFISVDWEFQNGGTGGQYTTQKTTKKLSDLTPSGWDAGKQYTYNLTISLNEIVFSPSVELWETSVNKDVPLK